MSIYITYYNNKNLLIKIKSKLKIRIQYGFKHAQRVEIASKTAHNCTAIKRITFKIIGWRRIINKLAITPQTKS